MDQLEHYRQVTKQLLNEYAQYKPADGEIEMETIFDDRQDHYQLMAVGWDKRRRVHGCVIHIDIKDGKVWLQHDSTDTVIAQQLVELGIPKEDIVIGFQPEHGRKYTGFGSC